MRPREICVRKDEKSSERDVCVQRLLTQAFSSVLSTLPPPGPQIVARRCRPTLSLDAALAVDRVHSPTRPNSCSRCGSRAKCIVSSALTGPPEDDDDDGRAVLVP